MAATPLEPFSSFLRPQIQELMTASNAESELVTLIQEQFGDGCGTTGLKDLQPGFEPGFATTMHARRRMDDDATAKSSLRGLVADDEVVAAQGVERFCEHDLTVCGPPRCSRFVRPSTTSLPSRSAVPMWIRTRW